MKLSDFDADGWELEDGEVRHAEAPNTFEIPALVERENLRTGQLVKLIFRIALRDEKGERSEGVERMWVIVDSHDGQYFSGTLDNDAYCADAFKSGLKVTFEPRHVARASSNTPYASLKRQSTIAALIRIFPLQKGMWRRTDGRKSFEKMS